MEIIKSDEIVLSLERSIKDLASQLDRPPSLGIIQVGSDSASLRYIQKKKESCQKMGFSFNHIQIEKSQTSKDQVCDAVKNLNEDEGVDGIVLQLPLEGLSRAESYSLVNQIALFKDVDALSQTHQQAIAKGQPGLWPCTVFGILYLMDQLKISVAGLDIVVVGNSPVVGAPLAQILTQKKANVVSCDRDTKDTPSWTRKADVVIVATGHPHLLKEGDFKSSAIVIDVGTSFQNDNLVTDVNRQGLDIKAITSPTGSVGPLTVVFLLRNLVLCALARQNGESVIKEDPLQNLFLK